MNLSKGTATGAGQSCGFSDIADVTGSAYADTITGDTNAHVIMAGAGADTVNASASAGADTVYGNGGADILNGNGGADKLIGGADADTLTGGAGNDTFVYTLVTDSPTTGPDLITDFVHGTDKIDLSALHTHSSDKFMIVSTGGYTYVDVDLLGNGSIDEMVKVAGANAVSTSDVIWANAAFPATLPHAATQSPEIAAHHELTNSLHAIAVDHGLSG